MDFISSISFTDEPLISWTFLGYFCHHFWVGATAKQQQTQPKVVTKMFNWSEVHSKMKYSLWSREFSSGCSTIRTPYFCRLFLDLFITFVFLSFLFWSHSFLYSWLAGVITYSSKSFSEFFTPKMMIAL